MSRSQRVAPSHDLFGAGPTMLPEASVYRELALRLQPHVKAHHLEPAQDAVQSSQIDSIAWP